MRVFSPWLKQFVAVSIVVGFFFLARLPVLSATERAAMVSRFHFTRLPLPELAGEPNKSIRAVHPSLERHSGWISAVGASVALDDLDGDRLADVTQLPYQSTTTAPMGCLPGDLNEDGAIDLLVYYWGRTPVAFLQTAHLQYVQQEIAPSGEIWNTNAATFSDLDGDGHADPIVGNYFPDGAAILDPEATGMAAMQHSMTRADNGGKNRSFRWLGVNQSKVQYREVEGILDDKIAHGWTLAVGTADLDGDLLPEIYFANDFGPDRLLHNRSQPGKIQFALLEGQKHLTTPNSKVLGRDGFKGMGVDFSDLNHDSLLDIYVSNIASEYALEESHFLFTSMGKTEQMAQGIAPYEDRSEPLGLSRSGWAWESKLGDFDNDGELEAIQATGFRQGTTNRWPELHELALSNDELLQFPWSWFHFQEGDDLSGSPVNPFFVRASDGRYYDLAKDLGLDDLSVTRGIATADVDGDGDLDFAVANQWGTYYFYRNDRRETGEFLGLRLLRDDSPMIGAAATVELPDGRILVAQVDGGNGHSGARSPDLHFGLGKVAANTKLPVTVKWRDTSGQPQQTSLLLIPGWHTIDLGRIAKKLLVS